MIEENFWHVFAEIHEYKVESWMKFFFFKKNVILKNWLYEC